MPLLVNSVPNLAQGVSQQPDNLRYPGQCDEQINAWATVVEGLVKRPPTKYKKNVNATDPGANLFTHFVKRDEDNKYCVTVSLGGVGVINLNDGTNYPVTVTSIASSYLSLGTSVTNPLKDIRALTVADYTFLVNKKKAVAKDADSYSPSPKKEALITVNLGDYSKYYSIYIDNALVPYSNAWQGHATEHDPGTQPATYKSGNGGGAGSVSADTEHIAADLASLIALQYSTARTGVTDITFSNDSSNWLEGSFYVIAQEKKLYGSTRDRNLYIKSKTKKRLKFNIVQNSPDPNNVGSTFLNVSAKGTCEVAGGVITSFSFSHNGNYYDTDTTTYPLSVTLKQEAYVLKRWRPIFGNSPTAPSTLTPSVQATAPFIVDRQGSVIKIDQTRIVSNGGLYYYLLEEHEASADNEPGSGQFWADFWQLTSNSSGAVAWSSGNIYNFGSDFSIRTTDGLSNQGLKAIYKEVESITDLPKQCFNNFTVKVKGDADIAQDDYFVRFSTKDKEDFGEGSWIETVGWVSDENDTSGYGGIQTKIEAETMPVTLVPKFGEVSLGQDPNLIYRFKLQTPQEDEEPTVNFEKGWRSRQAGNDETNPFPSFVGKTINDVFFFKNRLGFLTDSNVIFSEADEYFNFFRTTTQQLLDSAPIDVGLSHTKVAVLQHAVPFQEKLMLFSKQSQFVLRGADVLSPKTVAISPVTEYDISDTVEPIALGNYIYFTFKRNDFEGMYEYFVDNNTETFHSEEITSQIPKYITADVKRIAGSQSENTIVVGTSKDPKTLFVYKYFWSNKEKIQSAWMKFTFGRDVRGFDFIDSNLHLITADSEGLHLESLTLEDGLKDTDLDYTLYLDSRVDGSALTTSYDAPSKTTTISGFPFDPVNVNIYTKKGHKVAFTKTTSTAGTVSGTLANYVTHSGTIYKCETTHTSPSSFVAVDTSVTPNITYWTVSTDVATAPEWVAGKFYNNEKYFFAGIPYNMLYRFSDQTLKQPTERGGRSASDYAFQTIRNGSIDYAETGHFTVEVTPKYRDTYSYAFNPDIVGANLTLNTFVPQSGHFRFPVQAQPNEATIEVKSSSALPVKLLAAEFESMMIPRSRRYGA